MRALSLSTHFFWYGSLPLYTHLSTHNPSLYPFLNQLSLSVYTDPQLLSSLAPIISIPISLSESIFWIISTPIFLAPIHSFDQASTDLPSFDPQAPIRSDQIRFDRDLPSSDPRAPIVPVKCISMFSFFSFFHFWASESLCWFVYGCVWVNFQLILGFLLIFG